MQDQIRLDGTRRHPAPLAPGAHRHLRLQGRRRQGLPPRLSAAARPVAAQQPVDGGRAHLQEQPPDLGAHLQLLVPLQGGQQAGDRRRQQLAAHPVTHFPEAHQRRRHRRPVAPGPPAPHHSRPQAVPEQADGGLPVQAGGLAKLVQNLRLLSFPGCPVPGSAP